MQLNRIICVRQIIGLTCIVEANRGKFLGKSMNIDGANIYRR